MRKSLILTACCLLLLGIFPFFSACSPQPSASQVQTAVAGTLEAAPIQPIENQQVVEITQVKEVTKIIEVQITSAAKPTDKNTATATPQPAGSEATPTVEQAASIVNAPTDTPTPVEPGGSLGYSLTSLVKRYDSMTDLQKRDYVATLPGKTVFWTGQVYNITSDGIITLLNPFGTGKVTMKGIPVETAKKIDKGMLVEFTGMIESFGGTLVPDIVVVNIKLIRYYQPPTPTPTPTR